MIKITKITKHPYCNACNNHDLSEMYDISLEISDDINRISFCLCYHCLSQLSSEIIAHIVDRLLQK